MSIIDWDLVKETRDKPKMLEVYLEQAWQDAFCYALAVDEDDRNKLLVAIVSGNDSTLQAMRAAIDIGTGGLYFGYGEKDIASYRFNKEFQLRSEKGSYEKFPITINQNRKALAIVHDHLLGNNDYILSFEGDPAEDIRQVLGGGKYGLHILPEWKDVVFNELRNQGFLQEVELYYDKDLFPDGFSLLKLDLEEEQADDLISTLIRKQILKFPNDGSGTELNNVTDLTGYMSDYVNEMVKKISEQVKPTHDPMIDQTYTSLDAYNRPLFPVQAHVATAIAKRLKEQRAVLLQGEMSTGKTSMLTALADAYYKEKGKKGFFSCVMVPPSLTKKWPEEIKEILPDVSVHLIKRSEDLIRYHSEWIKQGCPKPTRPTFFVISFTTMRGDSAIEPAISFQRKKTLLQDKRGIDPYRSGYYCPDCGEAQQVIESTDIELNDEGEEITVHTKRLMDEHEFGVTRRLHKGLNPPNAFCSECGTSLWTKRVPTRYESFSEWAKHEKSLVHALKNDNQRLAKNIQLTQPEIPKAKGYPRRVATIEYIRRKMKNFFDITLVDEIHMLKSGMTAQGNSLGSLVAASKKVVGGTGTLFGGKAEDIYYLLWRLFPHLMVENGFKYSEVRKWNEEYGNIETTTVNFDDKGEYSNKQSRGGTKRTEKVLPGISPFVFGKFLVQNSVLVRLVDVWPDPVELVDVPTILVDMNDELKSIYDEMIHTFQSEIDKRKDGYKLYLPMTQTGIAFPDNPFTYPDVLFKTDKGDRDVIWNARRLPREKLLNKEKKLQEIIRGEMAEGRKSIVYVRDTGSSVKGRDVRPRIKEVLEDIGAKVDVLDTTSTSTNTRSEWLAKRINDDGYDVIIVSQELVKVGLDLISTPTLIFYQFSWSLYTINQAARRAWRIGQDQECRLYYLAYRNSYQEQMAEIIAQKNKAASALNGEVSTDGLSAMLGDEGDLQSMLIKSIKNGENLKGSTEEWVAESSDRARELLAGIGKKKTPTLREQFITWVKNHIEVESTRNVLLRKADEISTNIEDGLISGFKENDGVLEIDLIEAFGFEVVADGAVLSHLVKSERKPAKPDNYNISIFEIEVDNKKSRRRKDVANGQLSFSLFD